MASDSGKSVDINIRAKDKTKRALKSAQKNIKNTSKEARTLADRFRNVARATAVMEGPLGGTAGRLSTMATLLGNVSLATVAMGIAFTGMTAAVFSSFKKFSQFESSTFKINSLLEQTQYASGQTADSIEEMSLRIGRDTLESADGIRQASAVLLSFKSIAGDAFERTITVATDLAAITGQDLKQSVIQLGKALEDPATGMSALRRSGVSFTNSQKDMIVTMRESGNVAGAQAEILKLLEGQLGGTGVAAGKGLAGSADAVSEAWTRLLVNFAKTGSGQAATVMLTSIANAVEYLAFLAADSSDSEASILKLQIKNGELRKEIIDDEKNSRFDLYGIYEKDIEQKKEEIRVNNEAIESIKFKVEMENALVKRKSEIAQEGIAKVLAAEKLATEEKIRLKEIAKEFESGQKEADTFGEELARQNQQLQDSFLSKSQLEDEYLARRLEKIQENLDAEFSGREEASLQAIDAREINSLKMIQIDENTARERDKIAMRSAKLENKLAKSKMRMLGNVASAATGFVRASGKENTTAGKIIFAAAKGLAIAQSIMNTRVAITAAMAMPNLSGVPLIPWIKATGYAATGLIAATSLTGGGSAGGGGGGGSPGVSSNINNAVDAIQPIDQDNIINDGTQIAQSREIILQLPDEDTVWSTSMIRNLVEQMGDTLEDMGSNTRVVIT